MKMTNLCTLDAQEIFKMFHYIEKFAPEGYDKKEFALTHIKNFFDHLDFKQEIELFSLLENQDYSGITEFIKKYPTMPVNLDGDSKVKAQNGYDAKAISLDAAYTLALKNKTNEKAKQIIDARELTCLKEVKEYPYVFERVKMIKDYGNLYVLKSLKMYEDELSMIPNIKRFLALVFEYFRNNPKKNTFLEYVFYYLDVLRLDKEKKCALTIEYLETIDNLFSFKDKRK